MTTKEQITKIQKDISDIFIKRMYAYANKPLDNRLNAYDELYEASQEVHKYLDKVKKK